MNCRPGVVILLARMRGNTGRSGYTEFITFFNQPVLMEVIMEYDQLLRALNENPVEIEFDDVIELIDDMYEFTPVRFTNGDLVNEAGQNTGSCKIFAFARRTRLSEQQTLYCFGAYYRDDVLKHPDNMDHQNIRNFMKTGWAGIDFDGVPLAIKH